RDPLQHAGHGPARDREDTRNRIGAFGPLGGRTARVRPTHVPLHEGHRLCDRDGVAPTAAVRARRLARLPRSVDARPVPSAVTVFPHELYQAPRSWTEQAY